MNSIGACKVGDSDRDNAFLVGRTVYLRPPIVEEDVIHGRWHTWFNDLNNTRFLSHGAYPVTPEAQAEYVKLALREKSTLLLCIVSMATGEHEGVISLKSIDHLNRMAEIGIVTAPGNKMGGVGAFEAMALLIKHAFSRLNLESLYAGQHEGLWKWVNSLSMLGFRVDGFRRHGGVRNRKAYGIFHTTVSVGDFEELEAKRGGDILNPSPIELLRLRPRTNPAPIFSSSLNELNSTWRS